MFGGQTNGTGNGSTITAGQGCSNGFGATGSDVTLTGGSTAASNGGGNVVLNIGTGGAGNGALRTNGLFNLYNNLATVGNGWLLSNLHLV